MKKVAPERTCPVCLSTWRHDRAGAPPKLCTACRDDFGWCSDGKHAVPRTSMSTATRCRPCSVVLVRRQQEEKRQWLRRIKVERGCVDCGYNAHPDALDFDHLPEHRKEFNISRGVLSRSWAALRAEVEKCEVRCANCHRIKTAERLL